MARQSELTRAIGKAIENIATKYPGKLTHAMILSSLENLRHEFTEDWIAKEPQAFVSIVKKQK